MIMLTLINKFDVFTNHYYLQFTISITDIKATEEDPVIKTSYGGDTYFVKGNFWHDAFEDPKKSEPLFVKTNSMLSDSSLPGKKGATEPHDNASEAGSSGFAEGTSTSSHSANHLFRPSSRTSSVSPAPEEIPDVQEPQAVQQPEEKKKKIKTKVNGKFRKNRFF